MTHQAIITESRLLNIAVKVWKWFSIVLLVKVLVAIVANYVDYFPPNFDSAFLMDHERTFFGSYQIAFYTHIISTPIALLNGLWLVLTASRRSWANWRTMHRRAGKLQVALILLFVAPSGLWMSAYAATGAVAGCGFATLAILLGLFVILGWQAALNKDFVQHSRWMSRSFVLMLSAIVLRLVAGASLVFGWESEWLYPATAWLSWLVPLALFELFRLASLDQLLAPRLRENSLHR